MSRWRTRIVGGQSHDGEDAFDPGVPGGDRRALRGGHIALDAAADGDTVLVKPGEYVIADHLEFNRNSEGKDLTLRSEGGPERTVIQSLGVLFRHGESETSRIEGFTITGGGPGITCSASSPTIVNCVLRGNVARGGGMQTTTGGRGAGVYCSDGSSPHLIQCTIARNDAKDFDQEEGRGGGIYCSDSSPVLIDCIVWGNTGGSVDVEGQSAPDISYSCIDVEDVWAGEGGANMGADRGTCEGETGRASASQRARTSRSCAAGSKDSPGEGSSARPDPRRISKRARSSRTPVPASPAEVPLRSSSGARSWGTARRSAPGSPARAAPSS